MASLMEKCVLLLSGIVLLVHSPADAISSVAALLFIVVISSLNTYIHERRFTVGAALLYMLLSIFYPVFCVFFPLLYYDLFMEKQWVVCAAGLYPLYQYYQSGETNWLYILLFLVFSFVLQHYLVKVQELDEKLRVMRDTSTEMNNLLKSKNEDLLEKQDYEVHVARLEERNRIAREIHDNVGHMLSRSILQVGALMAVTKDENSKQQMPALQETLTSAMNSIRESVHDLHDESIDLYATITSIIKDFPSYTIDLDYDVGEAVPKNIKFCFIAVVKEALSNAAKHSNATKIYIILREHPSMYQLSFNDNGTNASVHKDKGLGLQNMEERVQALYGSIHITAENGFRIFLSIPK